MARRQYLISYDVADDKRRNKVFEALIASGDHVQYSVFFCALNPSELATLRAKLTEIIHHRDDQVILLDLGNAENPLDAILECLGKGYNPSQRVQVV